MINDTIHVTDTNGGSFTFSSSGSTQCDKTFTCDGDQGTHNNTATIVETGQFDSASVTVNCYALEVRKDASTTFKRTYQWTIDKSADKSSLTLSTGQSFLVNYSVAVNVSGFTDSDWAVSGNIVVHNPAPIAATINSVSDVVSGVGYATVLNILNGASSTPQVSAAISFAESFFATKTPGTPLTPQQRNQVISYATVLDQYNNGLTGPGHCSE